MSVKPWVVLCLGAVLCLAAGVIPPRKVLVKNNTALRLTCKIEPPNGGWTRWFALAAGAEWTDRARSADPYLIRCRPPVRQSVFRLVPGERYSLLRAAGGPVTLHRVTPDE